jgi:superfamily II DNA or RNA helicase
MQLRPRQDIFVRANLRALKQHKNTLGQATVGFGKTICIGAGIGMIGGYQRSLTLQHREELLDQNLTKFKRVNPGYLTAAMSADVKRWTPEGHNFAMVQTLVKNLDRMTPVDILTIDEGHHAPASTYRKIIDRARELNPDVHLWLLTATPERADGKGLREVVDNVADVVTLGEMVQAGFLVRPRTVVIDLGINASSMRKTTADFDMDYAAQLLDLEPITEKVFEEWKKQAGDRRTVGFATNVEHSMHMTDYFVRRGITAEHIDGETPKDVRRKILQRLDRGTTQVVWNCNVLTEGFDSPSVSAVILHRPFMHLSTMVQMAGRGLRTISEPENYPGIIKDDCIIFDFGASIMEHRTLESECNIEGRKKGGEAPTKECEECGAVIPASCRVCPICQHAFEFDAKLKTATGEFMMTEVELMKMSPFHWETLWSSPDPNVVMANALTAWCCLIEYGGIWFAYGGIQGKRDIKLCGTSHDKILAMVKADDFLREHGDKSNSRKSRSWLTDDASDKQYELLGEKPPIFGRMSKYRAACMISWKWNESKMQQSIFANFKNFR